MELGNKYNEVLEYVCDEFGVTREKIMSKTSKIDIVVARRVAIYIIIRCSDLAPKQICAFFGFKDVHRISAAVRFTRSWIETDDEFKKDMTNVLKRFITA